MSSLPTKSRQWVLANHPEGLPTYGQSDSAFNLKTVDLPSLQDGQILVQTLYLSNDPAQRGWISPPSQIDPKRLYVPPVKLGDPMRARGLAKVLASKANDYAEGDIIQGTVNWVEYAVVDVKDPMVGVRKIQDLPGGLSITHYLGALGSTGLTAYYGFVEVVGAKKGERVVVSGAAGATGSMVIQIAKHIVGASYVVGIAGSDEKCRWVESLGADKCLNYKSKDFEQELKEACGEGVDVYFDNVGGQILDYMLANMSRYGRIAACGAITGYNGEAALPMKNYFNVINYLDRAVETVGKLIGALKEGKIKIGEENETVVDTKFEDVPKTWLRLFEGSNQGKLVTKYV
ncbi:quinone oxidoreductase [Lithohypha guttulata]|uniref:Quinone oxidoreductase n=1 Tax=Lithohypha guttulata TaxID=1690604 RepID=A0AAN7SXL1_9EURO|nr:quinone oxidoreductase [Lithohypha guttulata]